MLLLWRSAQTSALIVDVAAVAAGWALELYRPSVTALVAESVEDPADQVSAFALYQLGASVGLALGPAVGRIVAAHSYAPLFIGDALTSVVWAVGALIALPRARRVEGTTAETRSAVGTIVRDRRFLRFWLATLLVSLILFQAQCTFPLWVTPNGHSSVPYGLLLGLNSALTVLFQLPLSFRTRNYERSRVLAVGSLFAGGGFGLLALGGSLPLLVASVVVWSGSELISWPVARAWLIELAPPGLVGRYVGAQSLTFGLGLTLAPLLGVRLYIVDPHLLWLGCGIVGFAAAGIIATGEGGKSSRAGRLPREASGR